MIHDDIISRLRAENRELSIEMESFSSRIRDRDTSEYYRKLSKDRVDRAMRKIVENQYIIEALNFYRRPSND